MLRTFNLFKKNTSSQKASYTSDHFKLQQRDSFCFTLSYTVSVLDSWTSLTLHSLQYLSVCCSFSRLMQVNMYTVFFYLYSIPGTVSSIFHRSCSCKCGDCKFWCPYPALWSPYELYLNCKGENMKFCFSYVIDLS